MTDIVGRLPKTAGEAATMDKTEIANACITAAAEIEWLRGERDRLAADLAKAHKDAVVWMEKVHQPAAEIARLREALRGIAHSADYDTIISPDGDRHQQAVEIALEALTEGAR